MNDDNSLIVNIEAIDDASAIIQGVAESATSMAGELQGAAEEANTALQDVGIGADAMASSIVDATVTADESMAGLDESAVASSAGVTESMNEMANMGGVASEEFISSVNNLNEVMAVDSADISEEAIAIGNSFDEAAGIVLGANESIESSTTAGVLGMGSMAASLLLISQKLGQASTGINNFISSSYKDTENWNIALLAVQQTLKNTGSSIPLSEVTDFAKQMQSTTLFQQQNVLGAAEQILTYKDLGANYKQITSLAADVATKMGVLTDSAPNLAQAAKLVSDALENPISGLGRLQQAGITVTPAVQKSFAAMAKAGGTAYDQAALIKILSDSMGGLAAEADKASGTGLTKLANDISSMKQDMPKLTDAIDKIATAIDSVLKGVEAWIEKNPTLFTDILLGTAVFLALATLLTGVLAMAILFVIGISAGISLPWILAGVAIAAVVLALMIGAAWVVTNWKTVQTFFSKLWTDFKNLWKDAIDAVTGFFETWYNKIMGWINAIENSLTSIGKSIGGAVSGAGNAVGGVMNSVGNAVLSIIPHFEAGGIVNGAQLAMVGESGPEAIIPLSMMGNGTHSSLPFGSGGSFGSQPINVYVTGEVLTTESQATKLGNMIAKQINRQLKLTSFR